MTNINDISWLFFYSFIVRMWYNCFSSSEIEIGAPDIKSRPDIVFGNAITFFIFCSLHSKDIKRSNPKK